MLARSLLWLLMLPSANAAPRPNVPFGRVVFCCHDKTPGAMMAAWGSVAEAWTDILHNLGRARFIPSYQTYLLYQ